MDGSSTARMTPPAPPGSAPYLEVIDLVKRYGRFEALKGVSLAIPPGAFVCFLGPSGCGKTTLLRAIAGLEPQSSGRILQAGKDISNLPPAGRDFGIVFQSYALFPNLSVADNIGYGLRSRGGNKAAIRARVAELLALVGLAELGGRFPTQLSGGQQQRVALARALATEPGLLLLDEPLSALDARVRQHLRQELRALQRRLGVTTILVTHDQEEALTMADLVVVMSNGRIEQIGSPAEIYDHPATPFVAEFVGTMNMIDAEVTAAGQVRAGGLTLASQSGDFAVNSRIRACFRPESILILPTAGTGHPLVEIEPHPGEIVGLEFLGATSRLTLRPAGGGPELLADVAAQLVARLGLAVGAAVRFAVPPEAVRLFPVSG